MPNGKPSAKYRTPIHVNLRCRVIGPTGCGGGSGLGTRAALEASELVEKAERLKRPHAIEEHFADEVVAFVLDYAGVKIGGGELHRASVAVIGRHFDARRTRH